MLNVWPLFLFRYDAFLFKRCASSKIFYAISVRSPLFSPASHAYRTRPLVPSISSWKRLISFQQRYMLSTPHDQDVEFWTPCLCWKQLSLTANRVSEISVRYLLGYVDWNIEEVHLTRQHQVDKVQNHLTLQYCWSDRKSLERLKTTIEETKRTLK